MGTDTADQQTEQAAPARHRLFAAVDPAGRIRHAGDVIRLGVIWTYGGSVGGNSFSRFSVTTRTTCGMTSPAFSMIT